MSGSKQVFQKVAPVIRASQAPAQMPVQPQMRAPLQMPPSFNLGMLGQRQSFGPMANMPAAWGAPRRLLPTVDNTKLAAGGRTFRRQK